MTNIKSKNSFPAVVTLGRTWNDVSHTQELSK